MLHSAAAVATLAALAAVSGNAAGAVRCPADSRYPPTSTSRAARTTLVPRGARSVLLCRYAGLNDRRPLALGRARRITNPAAVAHLVRAFDALPAPPSRGATSCPMDDASRVIALFTYSHAPRVAVTVDLTGCTTATNGHVTRWALYRGSAFIAQLGALTG